MEFWVPNPRKSDGTVIPSRNFQSENPYPYDLQAHRPRNPCVRPRPHLRTCALALRARAQRIIEFYNQQTKNIQVTC